MALMLSFSHLLDEARHLLLDLLEPGLGVGGLGGVHLVHGDDELLHTQGVGEQSVLPGDDFMNSSNNFGSKLFQSCLQFILQWS